MEVGLALLHQHVPRHEARVPPLEHAQHRELLLSAPYQHLDLDPGREGELHLAGDVKKTKKKLTWLADTPDLVKVELVDLDYLITKDKPEEDDKLEDILAKESYFPFAALGEASLRTLKKGETIQVERRGFYMCDMPYVRPEDPMKLLFVPDGKQTYGVLKP